MNSSELVSLALPLAITIGSAVLASFLHSPGVKAFFAAFNQKAAAEAGVLLTQIKHNNNAAVREMIIVAMAYAEQHEPEVLASFKSKADFVISKVTADPRFADLGVPLEAVAMILEDLFEHIYEGAKAADHT